MIGFRNHVGNEFLTSWWDNDNNMIAFCRGNKGFVAFNNEPNDSAITLNTCLPRGNYCDVISGKKDGKICTGKVISVNEKGKSTIMLKTQRVVAVHSGVRHKNVKNFIFLTKFFYFRPSCKIISDSITQLFVKIINNSL